VSGDIEVVRGDRTSGAQEPPEPRLEEENPRSPWIAHFMLGDDREIAQIALSPGQEEQVLGKALGEYRGVRNVEIEVRGDRGINAAELRGAMRAVHARKIPLDIRFES
jgi:hypothetical protein